MEDSKPEMEQLSLGSLLFRHWDRTLALSQKEYRNIEDKISTFTWSVRMFRGAIPDTFLTNKFKEKEIIIAKKHKEIIIAKDKNKNYSYSKDFENTQELFTLCINLLAEKGVLFSKVAEGTYDD